jgi:hypothetical protein
MATLDINGQHVNVDDSFLKLSPDEQQATVDHIAASLSPKVDPVSANDVGRSFASGVPILGPLLNKADAATNAGLSYALNPLFDEKDQLNGTIGERYSKSLAMQDQGDAKFAAQHPYVDTGAKLGAVSLRWPRWSPQRPACSAQQAGLPRGRGWAPAVAHLSAALTRLSVAMVPYLARLSAV